MSIAHVQCIKILRRIQGFLVILFTFDLVFFELKSLLRIVRQWSHEKFAIMSLKLWIQVRILIY